MTTTTQQFRKENGRIADRSLHRARFRLLFAAGCLVAASAHANEEAARKLAGEPGVIFARELLDVPGKNLVVVRLEIPARSTRSAASDRSFAHRHPGSVYVYVTRGTIRFGIEGQSVQVLHAGESAFEPVGAVHTILENTSTKTPATAIAVLLVPDGARIVTPVEESKK